MEFISQTPVESRERSPGAPTTVRTPGPSPVRPPERPKRSCTGAHRRSSPQKVKQFQNLLSPPAPPTPPPPPLSRGRAGGRKEGGGEGEEGLKSSKFPDKAQPHVSPPKSTPEILHLQSKRVQPRVGLGSVCRVAVEPVEAAQTLTFVSDLVCRCLRRARGGTKLKLGT